MKGSYDLIMRVVLPVWETQGAFQGPKLERP